MSIPLYDGVRVLVTGGGGFAGRHLLRALLANHPGELAATMLGDPPEFDPTDELSQVQWFSLDLTDSGSIREILARFRPQQIYHLAAQASVGQSFDAPLATWEINATGTFRLMEALIQMGPPTCRVILVSSAEVYGVVPPDAQPIGEDGLVRPITPYGASKAAAEIVALQAGRVDGLEVIVARSFNHIGPGQDERFVLPSMALQLARIQRGEAEPVLRVGNLEIERDLLDVRDAVRAYIRVMEAGEPGGVYNVSSGVAHSMLGLVRRMVELSETGATLQVDPERVRPADIPVLVGCADRLRALGWSPRFALDEALRDLLREAQTRS